MAKTRAAMAEAEANNGVKLSAKLRKMISQVKTPFMNLAKAYGPMAVKARELAPAFIAAFEQWREETGSNRYIEFLRTEVDPSIPEKRGDAENPGYRDNPSYQAAQYLKRIAGQGGGRQRTADDPARANDVVIALVASLVQVVPERQQGTIWQAMKDRLHWTDNQIARVKRESTTRTPLVHLRGVNLDRLRITIPAPTEGGAEQIGTGRTGTEG